VMPPRSARRREKPDFVMCRLLLKDGMAKASCR
jgi:hypothetical protein